MGLYDRRMQEYLTQQKGLMNLAGVTSGGLDTEIGRTIGNIGKTQAAGITAAAQARQTAMQNAADIGLEGIGRTIELFPASWTD